MVHAPVVLTDDTSISETLEAVYSAAPHPTDPVHQVPTGSTSMDMARTSAFFAAQHQADPAPPVRTDDMRSRNGITDE